MSEEMQFKSPIFNVIKEAKCFPLTPKMNKKRNITSTASNNICNQFEDMSINSIKINSNLFDEETEEGSYNNNSNGSSKEKHNNTNYISKFDLYNFDLDNLDMGISKLKSDFIDKLDNAAVDKCLFHDKFKDNSILYKNTYSYLINNNSNSNDLRVVTS